MKRSLLLLLAALLILGSLQAEAAVFQVTVHGSRKYNKGVGTAELRIVSQVVNNDTIFAAYNVSARNYVLVFDTNGFSLKLLPKRPTDNLPSFTLLTGNSPLASYDSSKPPGYLDLYDIAADPFSEGTSFEGITGSIQAKITLKNVVGGGYAAKSVMGSVLASSTGAASTKSLYTFSFSSVKVLYP